MAEEPAPADQSPPNPPAGAKAAESAALSNLTDTTLTSDTTPQSSGALAGALSNLSVSNDSTPAKPTANAATATAAAPEPKKKVKIDPADVAFLVQELEVSKARAGEMLREEGREAVVRGFVLPRGAKVGV